jgi:hypothetical protein
MKLKNLAMAVMLAASPFTMEAHASFLTLNPSATNGGAGTLDAGTSSFETNNSQTAFTSLLDVGATTGATTYSESGNLQILNFNPAPGTTSNVTNTYNVYATFKVQGTGAWTDATTFVADPNAISLFDVTIYGSPGCTTSGSHPGSGCGATSGLVFSTPTTGNATTLAQFGITQSPADFLLGNSTLIPTTTNQASFTLSSDPNSNSGGTAATNIIALVDFTPAAGTSGVGGFWEKPDPFLINIGTQEGGNNNNTNYAVSGGHVVITTTNVGGVNQGGGSLNYEAVVPEPGTLALLSAGLLAAGGAGFRRKA